MQRQRMRRYRNEAYDPWAERVDDWVGCSVCGFPLDAERTQEPEEAPVTVTTTGTTYHPGAGGSLSDIDLEVDTTVAPYQACPFCGSPEWRSGSAPGLRR